MWQAAAAAAITSRHIRVSFSMHWVFTEKIKLDIFPSVANANWVA